MSKIKSEMFKYQSKFSGILEELGNKRFGNEFSSSYETAGMSTSCSLTVYKALRLYTLEEGCGFGKTKTGNRVAEIDNGTTIDVCAVSKKGYVYAGTVDKATNVKTDFIVGDHHRGGTVIFLAIMDELLANSEARIYYDTIKAGLELDPEVVTKSTFESATGMSIEDWLKNLATISDNFYQRLMERNTGADVNLSISASGTCSKMKEAEISAGKYTPTEYKGTFQVLLSGKSKKEKADTKSLRPSEFAGKFANKRKLTKEEAKLVPQMDDNWTVPKEAEKVCNLIQKSADMLEPVKNIMLVGPAGTGKSQTSRFIALGLNRPHLIYTCHADTDEFGIIGGILPNTEDKKEKEEIQSRLRKKYNLPTPEDISFDLESAYTRLTGESELPIGFSAEEATSLLLEKTEEYMAIELAEGSKDFVYVPSPILVAMEKGYVIELQEVAVVEKSGALIVLNSLLEGGCITLPTGKKINRHKDTVVVITTNKDYFGCNGINQSLKSRMDFIFTIPNPSKEVMMQRVKDRIGFKNDVMLEEMTELVIKISEYLKKNGIDDGVCGVRELMSWAKAVMLEGEDTAYENCLYTIISKATDDDEEQANIEMVFLEPSTFAA